MIFPLQTYRDFASKIHALFDLQISKPKYNIWIEKVLLEHDRGLLYIKTAMKTAEGQEFEYDFIINLNDALNERQDAVEIATFEAQITVEEYTKALDIYGG